MTETADTTPRLLAVAEGAERLGQTRGLVPAPASRTPTPRPQVGRKWMLTESDIREALERTAVSAVAPMPSGPFPSVSPTTRAG